MTAIESYELPEPVHIEHGKVYAVGVVDEKPFLREATEDERAKMPQPLPAPVPPHQNTPGLIIAPHDMTVRWVHVGGMYTPAVSVQRDIDAMPDFFG
jgi:hypothetical protein